MTAAVIMAAAVGGGTTVGGGGAVTAMTEGTKCAALVPAERQVVGWHMVAAAFMAAAVGMQVAGDMLAVAVGVEPNN